MPGLPHRDQHATQGQEQDISAYNTGKLRAVARRLQAYLRWRNAHARHPDVLAAQRRERARIRSERQQRWGRPKPKAA